MATINYHKLRMIVADDFSSFRATVTAMLNGLGVQQVESVANGKDLLQLCQKKPFDVVLCDYDLGHGKNGQQVLEEIRHRQLLPRSSLFVIVTADTSRNVVMSAYDCEPDDYLMKPITAQSLEQRLNRLLRQREDMMPIYQALDGGDIKMAITLLATKASGNSRVSTQCQKMLGALYLDLGEYDRASSLYRKVQKDRPLDWARLGMAKVCQAQGDMKQALETLQQLINDSPLYLPAYDALATAWREQGDKHKLQAAVQAAVDISPMSIIRQQRLGEVAEENQDLACALKAFRRSVKLGQHSCHARAEDSFGFARTLASAKEKGLEQDSNLAAEALAALAAAKQRFELTPEQARREAVLRGRVHAVSGRKDEARAALADLEDDAVTELDLGIAVDLVASLRSLGDTARADKLLNTLLEHYRGNQPALEQLDVLLEEPASDNNRKFVARINQEGIELYEQQRFDDALDRFAQASQLFPKHPGIQLNIAQALLGKARREPDDQDAAARFKQTMELIAQLLEPGHPQYERYRRLSALAKTSGAGGK